MAFAMPQTEAARVAEYQEGWNDAQNRRDRPTIASTYYLIGFIEATGGTPNRFDHYEEA